MTTPSYREARVAIALLCLCLGSFAITQTPGQQRETRKLYSIEVEDADEAAIIQQELKVKPEVLKGRSLYYFGNEEINVLVRLLVRAPVKRYNAPRGADQLLVINAANEKGVFGGLAVNVKLKQ